MCDVITTMVILAQSPCREASLAGTPGRARPEPPENKRMERHLRRTGRQLDGQVHPGPPGRPPAFRPRARCCGEPWTARPLVGRVLLITMIIRIIIIIIIIMIINK